MLKTFVSQSARAIVALVLTVALFALPTPIGSLQKASAAAPTFGINNGSVPFSGMEISWLQANNATWLGLLPEPSSFTVTATFESISQVIPVASLVLTSNYLLDIILVSAIRRTAVVTVSYTAPTPDSSKTNKALQDTDGNDALSFGPLTVANNSYAAPTLTIPAAPATVAGS